MKIPKIAYIIKVHFTALSRPDYFAVEDRQKLNDMCCFLKDDCHDLEIRKVTNRDEWLEGILRRCALGSKRRNTNLQAYFNDQPEMKKGA